MAWSALVLRKNRFAAARSLARRTSALIGNSSRILEQLRNSRALPSPLWLALRGANQLAQRLLDQPSAPPTDAQRRALLAAGAQIRNLAAGILATGGAREPGSVEFQLAELIARTLALIDQVTREPLTIDAAEASPPKLG
jgi:hypothetical protein